MSTPLRKSNRNIIISGVGITAIAIVLAFYMYIPSLANRETSSSIQMCDNVQKKISIIQASGFRQIQPRSSSPMIKQDIDVSVSPVGIYEFALMPGSTANLKLSYDFCGGPNAQASRTVQYMELLGLGRPNNSTNPTIYRLNNNSQVSNDQLLTPVNSTDIGLVIHPVTYTKLNDHAITVGYEISAKPDAEKGTYVTNNFYGLCPGELITVGETPNNSSVRWANGSFYGCNG